MILIIASLDMGPYYEYVCSELQFPVDHNVLTKMKDINQKEIEKLEAAVKDAEENLGEIEIRDAKIAKAEYLSTIGDKVENYSCASNHILFSEVSCQMEYLVPTNYKIKPEREETRINKPLIC